MKKVLLVDDADFIRQSLKKMLERNGFDVIAEAENGFEAIDKFISLKPDLVAMDVTMPEMEGIKAIQKIMQYDPDSKVVAISAIGSENNISEAMAYGAKAFLIKPFREEIIINTLRKI